VPIQLAQCWFPGQAIFNAMNINIHIFQIKYTEAILPNGTRKQLRLEITGMLIAVLKNKRILLLIIIYRTLSFPTRGQKHSLPLTEAH